MTTKSRFGARLRNAVRRGLRKFAPAFAWVPDKTMISWTWWARYGEWPDLRNPGGFNEKLQWLKLHRNPDHPMKADKYRVRGFVAKKIGEKYLVPLLGAWENANDIDFASLPDKFVLKCNHNSGGGMVICRDKSKLDVDAVRKKLNRQLKIDYSLNCREWHYGKIKPMVIAEEFLEDKANHGILVNYKFFCFSGEPKFLHTEISEVGPAGKGNLKLTVRDLEWNVMPFRRPDHEQLPFDCEKPKEFSEMVALARKLSANEPFVRVDLYSVGGRVYFSELTMFPGGGESKYEPPEWEERIGSWIELPRE